MPCALYQAPATLGPTWQVTEDGSWYLPEHTLGWQVIEWCGDNLLNDEGEPWTFTLEQARLLLWIYAVDERGRFLYREIVLQRMKGWGKDPFAAVLAAVEFVGPCRFSHWENGEPVAKEHLNAWVQIAAVSAEQTKNTMKIFPGLFTDECRAEHGIDLGKEKIYAHNGMRAIEIMTSGFRTAEGNRPTFQIHNETHHWIANNGGHDLRKALRRNTAKSKGGTARFISITNAYHPGEDSIAERQRNAYLQVLEGTAVDTRVLYDSLEAPTGSSLYPPYTRLDEHDEIVIETMPDGQPVPPSPEVVREHIRRILLLVRGDAEWLDIDTIIDEILNQETSVEEAKRFYFNSVTLGSDASFDPEDIRAAIDPEVLEQRKGYEGDPLRVSWRKVGPEEPIVIFGDGSKSDDSTGLVGCRLSDGYVFTIGVWERPPEGRARTWTAPRDEIDARVHEAFARFNVVAFWFDPSHAKDDTDGSRYWDTLVDAWHQEWGDRLQAWAQQSGDRRSAVGWDMTSPQRKVDFVQAVERFTDELESRLFMHDGHPVLVKHLINCRRRMTDVGLSVSKASRTSKNKIDLGVCAIGARMLRRFMLNKGIEDKPKSSGWWAPVDQ